MVLKLGTPVLKGTYFLVSVGAKHFFLIQACLFFKDPLNIVFSTHSIQDKKYYVNVSGISEFTKGVQVNKIYELKLISLPP